MNYIIGGKSMSHDILQLEGRRAEEAPPAEEDEDVECV